MAEHGPSNGMRDVHLKRDESLAIEGKRADRWPEQAEGLPDA